MKIRYENLNAEWKVMDVRDMKLESQSFDVAIDKATMDSMFHGSMWDPPDDVRTNIESYLSEVDRVLAPSGTFLYITYRQPHFMKPLLARVAWDLTVESLPDRPGGGVFEYFVYVMKKRGTSDIRDTSGANTEEGSEVSLSSSSSQVSLNSSDTSGDS